MTSQATSAPTRRWFNVGHSAAADSGSAGSAATMAAVAGRSASLVMVFAPVEADMPRLAEGVRGQVGPDTIIIGCSTPRAMAADAGEGAVVVAALGGPGFQVRAAISRDSSTHRRESGIEAASSLAGIDLPHRAVVLLTDGVTMLQHEIVRGAYSTIGAVVPLVGGSAGDNFTWTKTYQIYGNGDRVEVLSDAVVAVSIGSEAPLGVGIAHGWRKQGEPVSVTSSSDGHMFELDNERAMDVFLRRTGIDQSLAKDEPAFRLRASQSPMGLSRRSGEDMRVMHDIGVEEGSVICLADVPQGALAWFMETDRKAMIAAAADSCAQAIAQLDGAPPMGMLAFDCAVRYSMLGADGVEQEIEEIARAAQGAPLAGFYTFGEIARTRGARGMHHLTCVSLALA